MTRIFAFVLLASSCVAQELPESLRAGLVFELGASGWSTAYRAVESVQGQALVPSNGVARSANWYTFDGTNDVIGANITAFQTLHQQRNFTIALWIRRNIAASAGQQRRIMGTLTSSADHGFQVLLDGTNAACVMYIGNGSGGGNFVIGYLDAGTVPQSWSHVVYTFENASTAKAYLNGAFASQKTTTNALSSSAATLAGAIGTVASTTWFSGDLALVQIWQRALTADEVLALYWMRPPNIYGEVQ